MSALPDPKSIHDLPPLERGGVEARKGFEFQDHVAAGLLIDMLLHAELLEVWCETHDDITLIWQGPSGEQVEFVQVKALTLNQLWSVAKLAERKRKEKANVAGSSILERSLANDRCKEPSQFRIVTTLPPNEELSFLQRPFASPDRQSVLDESADLIADLEKRLDGFQSQNGNGVQHWLENTIWDVRQSNDSLADSNTLKLQRVVSSRGSHLFPDQLDEVYSEVLALARTAAVADWGDSPAKKKLTKATVARWLDSQVEARLHPAPTAGITLESKLQRAGICNEDIAASLELRQRYLTERYSPQYLTLSKLRYIEGEVAATLHTLRAKLDAGDCPDDGPRFHSECLTELGQLHAKIAGSPLSILQGCMYNITDRCTHRFRRATA